tara:strand:+ start:700 stop:1179 length:480 start_codon:yes stop_codon:yes gene_type:complete
MIQGVIPVTWAEADYKNLTWVTNKVHEEKFNATVDTQNYNVGVYMCFENLPAKFYDAVKDLGLNKVVVAVNKLTPGQILPYHTDRYNTYKARNGITEQDEIIRIIVFLHEQKAGHQLWIEDKVCVGPAGSYFGWGKGVEHMAANLGSEDRYILQVTGIK